MPKQTHLDVFEPDLESLPGPDVLRSLTCSSFLLEPVDCYLTL
jgi:hypothetical protein